MPPGLHEPVISLDRLNFRVPDRAGLPPLREYAHVVLPEGGFLVAGYTEASRGCKHLCRHCPIVPVYGGLFRVVQRDVVLEDVRHQVEAGASTSPSVIPTSSTAPPTPWRSSKRSTVNSQF